MAAVNEEALMRVITAAIAQAVSQTMDAAREGTESTRCPRYS